MVSYNVACEMPVILPDEHKNVGIIDKNFVGKSTSSIWLLCSSFELFASQCNHVVRENKMLMLF